MTRTTEEVVRLTAKMYEAREAARFVFAERYRSLIEELSLEARSRADTDGVSFLQACTMLAHETTDSWLQLLLIAAAVEQSEQVQP